MTERTVSDVVVDLIDVLEPSGETYAFGGAVALAAWSEPRATADVDVVLWIPLSRVDAAIDLVQKAGVAIDPTSARTEAEDRGMFIGQAGRVRVDVFVPSIPFYDEAEGRRVRTEIANRPTWVHSPEVLAVFKMLFFRPKDLVDVERLVQVRGDDFDRQFVRKALIDMMGTDPRVEKWDAICERNPPASPR
ncbi:MAG: nucleotidyl transferase AbiEii/AbiGii toxin family protein [Myxococcota bacterium]